MPGAGRACARRSASRSWPISPRFPSPTACCPTVAREIFHTDQTGLGYLSASFAVGSLIGSITLSLAHGVRIARLLIGATLAWYAMLLVFVEISAMPVAMACLVFAGIAQSMSMISAAVILMRTASAHLRGRVMGVRMMVIYGLPLGLLAAGSLIDLDRLFRDRHALRSLRPDRDGWRSRCIGAPISGRCMRRRTCTDVEVSTGRMA